MKPKYLILSILCSAFPLNVLADVENISRVTEANDSIDALYDNLDDLVVTARKEVIKSDGVSFSYDVTQDDAAKGQSVLDVLKKTPMVSVDAQDQIYVNGNNGVKILVDGKENSLIQSNASVILKSMPSESISKIEVITEPGAKYDSEGTAGIINLITDKKQSRDGYSVSVGAHTSSQDYGANIFGSFKIKNFNADANIVIADNHGLWQENVNGETTHQYEDLLNYLIRERTEQKVGFTYMSAGTKMSWQPNERNLFSWGGSFLGLWGILKDGKFSQTVFDKSGGITRSILQDLNGSILNKGATADVSWRHNFDSEGQRVILAYAFNFGKNALSIKTDNENYAGAETMMNASGTLVDNFTREHTVQADYSNPFKGLKHLLEAGVKGIFRRNSTDAKSLSGNDTKSLTIIEDATVIADQIQDVLALYGSYTGHFGNWTAKGGIRYEHTIMGMDFFSGDYENFRRHLNDLVPNAAISYNFSPAHTLRLSYQMRISRPTINQLNPFKLSLVETEIRQGNENLSSERHNNVTLTYSNFGRLLGGNISLEYSQTDNTIEEMIIRSGDSSFTTYGNFGKRKDLRLSGFMNINITQKMTLSLNGFVSYSDFSAPSINKSNSGWGGSYGANWSYIAPGDVKLSAYGGQTLHIVNLNGYFGGWYYYGLGISRDFLKEKNLNIALSASNFLTTYSGGYSYKFGNNWDSRSYWKGKNWNVGISITWKFGHLQETAKQSGLDISNTDASSTGGNKSGGIGL